MNTILKNLSGFAAVLYYNGKQIHEASAPSRKTVLWCLALTVLAISQAGCGCGGFVPCVPDALLTASTSQLSFGNQSVATSSSPQTVTLSATGKSASLISSITTGGDFRQTNTCGPPNYLAPNRSCSVAVVFMPTATGTRTGQLIISQGIGLQIVVGLAGTGQ